MITKRDEGETAGIYDDLSAFEAGSHADILPSAPPKNESADVDEEPIEEETNDTTSEEEGSTQNEESQEQNSDDDDDQGSVNDDVAAAAPKAGKPAPKGQASSELMQKILDERTGGKVKLNDPTLTKEKLEELLFPKAPAKHPRLAQLEAAVAKGMDPDQFFQARSATKALLDMPDDQLLKQHYQRMNGRSEKNPGGWDDATIDGMITGQKNGGTLPVQALQVRNAIKQQIAEDDKALEAYSSSVKVDVNDPKVMEDFGKNLSSSLTNVIKDNKLFGLDVSAVGTRDALLAGMKKDLTPDAKTGLSEFTKALQSNDEFVELYLLHKMAKAGLIGKSMAQNTEKAKATFMKSLGLKPPSGGGSAKGDAGADYSAFEQPSGLVDRAKK